MAEKKRRRGSGPKYPMAVVRAVLFDVQSTRLSLNQIGDKYGLPKGSGSLISKWTRKYSSDFEQMEKKLPEDLTKLSTSTASLSDKETVLHKALEEAQMKIICLETMIDIAEKELNVSIRKKSGTKQ